MKQIIGRLACFVWLCFGMPTGALAAEETGMVMNMEGSMTAKGADGTLRELKIFSKVLPGDVLFTGKNSYARVKFSDGGQVSLSPTSQFRIDNYHFDAQQPEKDSAGFSLIKGGLRAISGLIGKRGDQDSYGVKTHTATVGIRGTKFGVLFCKGDCADIPTPDGKPPDDGMHLDVMEGAVVVKNAGGTQLFNAGQYGYVKEATAPPIIVPMERAVRVDIPAKIFLDRVKGVSGEKKRDEGKQDAKGAGAKAADLKAAGSKAAKPDGAKPDGAKSDGAKSDEAKSDEAKSDEAKSDEAKSEEAKSEEAKSEEAKSEEAKSEEAKSEEAKSEEAKSEEAEPGATEAGGSESGGSGGVESGGAVCPI